MKNLFKLTVFLLAVLVGGIFAVAPTSTISAAYYNNINITKDSTSTTFFIDDTFSVTDSMTIINKFSPKPNFEYVLQRQIFTGTGADTCKIKYVCDAYDGQGNLFARVVFDSSTAAAAESFVLPFGHSSFGDYYTVKAINYNAVGVQIIPGKWGVWRRRSVSSIKNDY